MGSPIVSRSDDILGIGYYYNEFGVAHLGAKPGVFDSKPGLVVVYIAPFFEHFTLQQDIHESSLPMTASAMILSSR
jgi:hypothetical protein